MRRLLLALTLVLGATGLQTAGPGIALADQPPAAAQDLVGQAVAALSNGPGVYLAPSARNQPLTEADATQVDDAVHAASTPLYIAALGEPSQAKAQTDLHTLIDKIHAEGTYVVVGTGGFLAGSDVAGVKGQVDTLVKEALAAHADPTAALVDFVKLVDAAAGKGDAGGAVPAGPSGSSSGGVPGWVPPVAALGGLAAIGLLVFFLRRRRRAAARVDAAPPSEAPAAEQDTTSR